jgi:ParB-like chromosome segregation protein Spo0J
MSDGSVGQAFGGRGTVMGRGKDSKETATSHLQIVYRPITELTLNPKNPRLHSIRQIRQIGRNIETFGFNVPVLVDAAGKIVAGHGRVMACKQLGRREVPTIRLDHPRRPGHL